MALIGLITQRSLVQIQPPPPDLAVQARTLAYAHLPDQRLHEDHFSRYPQVSRGFFSGPSQVLRRQDMQGGHCLEWPARCTFAPAARTDEPVPSACGVQPRIGNLQQRLATGTLTSRMRRRRRGCMDGR